MGDESVGTAYLNTAKSGKEYLSITINGEKYVGFLNYSKKDNKPYYKILKSKPRDDYPKPQEPPQPSPLDSDIPF